nr:MAG: hypothetical protein DIU78_25750 [Pseudomonadota bacterium]
MWLGPSARPAAVAPPPSRIDAEQLRARLEALAGPTSEPEATTASEPSEPSRDDEPQRGPALLDRPQPVRAIPGNESSRSEPAVQAPTSERPVVPTLTSSEPKPGLPVRGLPLCVEEHLGARKARPRSFPKVQS